MEASQDVFWLWQFLGRLHPLVVHFPVSLLCVALVLELLSVRQRSAKWQAGIDILLWIGTISAFVSVALGLLLANSGEYGGDTVLIHQWSGIATAVIAALALYVRQKKQVNAFRILLGVATLGVAIAGHYGAMLTHGDDYLTSVLPFGKTSDEELLQNANLAFISLNQPLNETQLQELNVEVRSIFAHNCYSCHGATKTKGELRLDKKEFIFQGGKNGPIFEAGHPENSEIIRRVTLPTGHKEAMPTKGKRLTERDVAVLKFWIKQGAPWPQGPEKSLYRIAALEPRLPNLPPATATLKHPIDRFTNVYFEKHNVSWKSSVDDRTYARRVYLDVIGLLPSPTELQNFLADNRPDKRERLVETLLNRNEDYAQHWLSFWNDALRNDYSGTGYITGGRFDITDWLYNSLKTNKPYNLFVKQLVSPTKESEGFIRGIKWRGTINSSQSTEMQAAQNVAQVFLGLNLKCASCHDSFISDWKLEDAYAFANVFADSTLEIHRCDKPTGKMAKTGILFKELGELKETRITKERLQELSEFLTQPKNGRLYRTIVNRVWAQLMGRGIVEPVDEMDKEPWSQDLLDWLAYDFANNGYDPKKLIFNILTSKTYQLPSVGVKEAGLLTSSTYKFEGMVRRRLSAEQFADAVSVAFAPMYADSDIVKKRLPASIKQEIPFVRAALVMRDPFQTALGRPTRETVSTSRMSQANLLQALELTNGSKFNKSLLEGAKHWQTQYPESKQLVSELYRRALGRVPLAQELATAQNILGPKPTVAGIQDLVWAITLHPEFQLIF